MLTSQLKKHTMLTEESFAMQNLFKSSNQRLASLSVNSPKEYWKIIRKKTHDTIDASIEDLYNYFRDMNANDAENGLGDLATISNDIFPSVSNEGFSDVLNDPFSLAEIKDYFEES